MALNGVRPSGVGAALQLMGLLLLALMMLLPLIWLLSTSLKGPAENIFASPPSLVPSQPSLQAYHRLFANTARLLTMMLFTR